MRTHGGTASAQGDSLIPSTTLDTLLRLAGADKLDLLKIDVDGYDGQVLLGAKEILNRLKPAVIFEWHPILCRRTGNNWTDHFNSLDSAGYNSFIWFNKFGEFSHFSNGYDPVTIERLADLCFSTQSYPDLHYDVIALPPQSRISPRELADASNAKRKKSAY